MSRATSKTTPMMAQWQTCKEAAGDALLFFRMGDFYEAFYDDAEVMARELDLTLTKRQETPMAGVPWHSADSYIDRLVAKGFKVAVAEQTEDPKQTKGLVKRDVVRVVTPGTLVDSSLVAEKSNNYFVSLAQQGAILGLALIDLTTAEFRCTEFESERDLLNELFRLRPAEFLAAQKFVDSHPMLFEELRLAYSPFVNAVESWHFDHQTACEFLSTHFHTHSLDGFGLKGMISALKASGALLSHLQNSLHLNISHITTLRPYSTEEFLSIDRMTQRNLELTQSLQDGSRRHTLLDVLDQTLTPMGGRLLKQWVVQPLLSVPAILQRQDAIAALHHAPSELTEALGKVRDLERLVMKVSTGYASPRDLVALRFSLEQIPVIRQCLVGLPSELLTLLASKLQDLHEAAGQIAHTLVEEPPARLADGGAIRTGFDTTLDELRAISHDGKSWLANYQTNLRTQFDIKTLKVGFNKVFGYYLEVSKAQASRLPDTFQRRQTLVNAERFISPELKEYETKVLTAEEKISALESKIFTELRQAIAQHAPRILSTARAIARLDALLSLATVAQERGYTRPAVDETDALHITAGRHPVIEAASPTLTFTPNDTTLDGEESQLLLITGPNMAGKSTFIRQVALIALMAQIGSSVPAEKARIGLVDKIFTRIGASDDLSRGQSTFMVEMTETANILNNATDRSLVILDEIGRGTSTYDGISIAWSVAEHLLTTPHKQARTLFATHYFELTQLEGQISGALNYNVAVREHDGELLFQHKIVRGSADRSYGIHVAKLAGMPLPTIIRAKQILHTLETNSTRKTLSVPRRGKKIREGKDQIQLTLFG